MCRYRIQLLRLYACHGASAIIGHANVSQITVHITTLMTVMATLAAQWQMIPMHVVRIWSLFFSFHVQRRSHRHIRSGPSDTGPYSKWSINDSDGYTLLLNCNI